MGFTVIYNFEALPALFGIFQKAVPGGSVSKYKLHSTDETGASAETIGLFGQQQADAIANTARLDDLFDVNQTPDIERKVYASAPGSFGLAAQYSTNQLVRLPNGTSIKQGDATFYSLEDLGVNIGNP